MGVNGYPTAINPTTGLLTYDTAVGRWATPYHGGVAVTSQAFTIGRVLLAMFELPIPRMVDAISYAVGGTSNGNVTVGIVGPIAAATDTALGARVVVQSASTAQGTANVNQVVTFTPTLLQAGVYYAALEGDSATGTYMRLSNQGQAPGIGMYYNRSGGYGALTDPTPAVTESDGNAIPGLRIRLA